MDYSDESFRQIFRDVRRIAVVGFSPNPARPSHYVARFLWERGYDIVPVNPGHAGATFLGARVAGSLHEIDGKVDMVDVFRRSEMVPLVVDEALGRFDALKVIWMQIGVRHGEAAARARAAGVTVVENRCPKIEYHRLVGGGPVRDAAGA